jgi:peptidase E
VAGFYEAFVERDCRVSHVALFNRRILDLRAHLMAQDVIYVGGGNTANMLAIWRVHGVDAILREAWAAGAVLCGVSAGAICWFEAGVTDSFGLQLGPLNDGLGLLAGSFCPHYDSEDRRRPVYQSLVGDGFPPGLAADDGVGLHFVGTELRRVVTSVPGQGAYRLSRRGGAAIEERIEPELL